MKYKIIILLFFITGCAQNNINSYSKKIFKPYSSKGFALIYSEDDFNKKIISTKLDNEKSQIAHRKLNTSTFLILRNPENNKSMELKITKKAKYHSFFNVVVTQNVVNQLELDPEFPFLEVNQRIKNKSFVAKKAEIFNEEKTVIDKAPVEKVKIANISKNKQLKKQKKKKNKKFYILVGDFYSLKSANNLKNILSGEYIKKELLTVKKLGINTFQLTSGPYLSINTLKNDYFELNKYGFEDLDIKQND